MTTRVLIVDDHPVVREGLAFRISSQADMEVCGEAANAAEVLKLLSAVRPHVVIVDIQLEASDGLDLVKHIKARDESIAVLVCSAYPDKIYAGRALKAGALGYINKQHVTSQVVDAVRRVRDGKVYLSEEMADQVLSQAVGQTRPRGSTPTERLSDRELEVFRLIGDGLSAHQIARRLCLSPHTIDTHRQRIKEKLQLANAVELAQAAVRWIIQGDQPYDSGPPATTE
ncbi:MAG: response regulator transcription factor [Thermoguttaceae bacterium]|nr:response regulator transcription factor [Thermoguttaceae bacterium]